MLAVAQLTGRPDVRVVGELLVLHLTRNPGAAFSTGTEYTVVLSVRRDGRRAGRPVPQPPGRQRRAGRSRSACCSAGVAGNLTDRLFRAPGPLRGHVVDFLMLPHWPVFNVADMCIDVAAVLILVQAFRGVRLDGAPATRSDPPSRTERVSGRRRPPRPVRCPRAWRASAWTPRWPGCSGSPAPGPPS